MKKIEIVIPIYKCNPVSYQKVKYALKEQTTAHKIIEVDNMTEAGGMNYGVKKANGEIVVVMSSDCIPENKFWLEKLVKPFEDKAIIVSVSDTEVIPYELWKSYSPLVKAITIKEQKVFRSALDARACAYRKKVFEEVGGFDDRGIIGIDDDFYHKIKNKGKIAYPGCKILHWHPMSLKDRLWMEYKYAKGAGIVTKLHGWKYHDTWKRIVKATPILGLLPIIYVYPFRRDLHLFPIYFLFSPLLNWIYFKGFFEGYFDGGKYH